MAERIIVKAILASLLMLSGLSVGFALFEWSGFIALLGGLLCCSAMLFDLEFDVFLGDFMKKEIK